MSEIFTDIEDLESHFVPTPGDDVHPLQGPGFMQDRDRALEELDAKEHPTLPEATGPSVSEVKAGHDLDDSVNDARKKLGLPPIVVD